MEGRYARLPTAARGQRSVQSLADERRVCDALVDRQEGALGRAAIELAEAEEGGLGAAKLFTVLAGLGSWCQCRNYW